MRLNPIHFALFETRRQRRLASLVFALGLMATVLVPAGFTPQAEAAASPHTTIGGRIWEGVNPNVDPSSGDAISGAKVMVQNQSSGGAFVTYGSVSGNSWTANVPWDGDYVVMFSAAGYDLTSREFKVDASGNATNPNETNSGDPSNLRPGFGPLDRDGNGATQETFLTPLPLPDANLLFYAFYDNYVNGEDDAPDDPAMNGVTVTVKSEDGVVLGAGITGNSPITLSDGTVIDNTDGLVYFTGLPPGEVIVTSDPSTAYGFSQPIDPVTGLPLGDAWNASTDFYLMTSEEGGKAWDPKLYPGDPGTEAGGYLIWHGYVQKLGQIGSANNPTPVAGSPGTISGTLIDADQANLDPAEPFPVPGEDHPGVTTNTVVPDGFVVLFSDDESAPVRPVATTEANPVTGAYSFTNVPPGSYKMFLSDKPIDYVWNMAQVRVAPGSSNSVSPLVPRFFARGQGYVRDNATGNPISGITVNLRYKSGSIKATTTTDSTGWYNFDNLPEIEALGGIDVELPNNRRGTLRTETFYPNGQENPSSSIDVVFNAMNRYVQWYTANYRSDFYLEPVPATTGDISGVVWNDALEPTGSSLSWKADGSYDPEDERTLHGVTVELWDSTETTLLATATTGKVDKAALVAQGWIAPYTAQADEFGGVFVGPLPGFYEFRDLAPGDYRVKVIPDPGFSPSPGGSATKSVTLSGGDRAERDFGLKTQVPLAGEIEGGVFDDIFIDTRCGPPGETSLLCGEKAGVPGAPVGAYDSLGYMLGFGVMGNPICFDGAPSGQCPSGEEQIQKPEMERRYAPGVHIFVGNDPSLPGFDPAYMSLALPYEFSQGQFKFEADWSIIPVGWTGGDTEVPLVAANTPLVVALGPANAAESNSDATTAATADTIAAGGVLEITGSEFGPIRGYGTVTLSGRQLDVVSWSDTLIKVDIPSNAISGPLLVATSTGITNGMSLTVTDSTAAANAVYVDAAATGIEEGTAENPWSTITEALDNLPSGGSRYVFVAEGTYYERPRIVESDVYIIGAGPHETTVEGNTGVTVIQQGIPNGGGSVFSIGEAPLTGAVENVMISGLTITGGSTADGIGGGIFAGLHNRGININNNVIVRNGGEYGGGIWFAKSVHDVDIWSNTIAENGNYGGYGGGISVNDEPEDPNVPEHAQPEHIVDDTETSPPPGTYQIYNNLIFHNLSADSGGGITLYEVKDRLNVYGNMVLENYAQDHGGGMFVEESGPIRVYDNVFLRNFSPDDGGAISFEDVGGAVSMDGVTTPFSDVSDTVHKGDIARIWVYGITLGCNPPDNTEFCPNSELTRAQFATFLTRALRLTPSNIDFFIDDDESVHETDINALAAAGITVGCNPPDNSEFCPGDSLTRGQLASMLTRALNLTTSVPDGFVDDDGSVHETNISALAAAGITRGCNPPDNTEFCPDRMVTRGEAATFVSRVLDDFTPQVEVFNNLFAENMADDHGENSARGGAIAFDDTFDAWVYNNTIVGNIVAGSEDPAGAGIDSERNGHEYDGQDAPYIAPGFSNPAIFNNIIWGNWRLEYDQPAEGGEEDLDYSWGTNYRWSPDQVHVDNPALQADWDSALNSESLSRVNYNDIEGGYAGDGNLDVAPGFVNPAGFDWRLLESSPVIDLGLGQPAPGTDLDGVDRILPADMGAYEYVSGRTGAIRLPTGILLEPWLPVPGSSSAP